MNKKYTFFKLTSDTLNIWIYLCIFMKLTNFEWFSDKRGNGCKKKLFWKYFSYKVSKGMLDCHYFSYRIEIKNGVIIPAKQVLRNSLPYGS